MVPDDEDVSELTRAVFVSLLGVEPEVRNAPDASETVSYTVDVSGGWHGSVRLQLESAFAEELARRMLLLEDVAPEDVNDAVGEIANMLGGNVKGLVPGPSRLSLPHATPPNTVPAAARTRLSFACDGRPFSVVVEGRSSR